MVGFEMNIVGATGSQPESRGRKASRMSLENRQVATCRRRAYTSAGVDGNGMTACSTVDKETRLDSDRDA